MEGENYGQDIAKKNIAACLAVSAGLGAELREKGLGKKTVFLPNGVDPSLFSLLREEMKRKLRRLLGIPPEAVVYLFCRRLEEEKGVDVLLSA